MDDVDASRPADAARLMKPAKDGVLQQRTLGRVINNVKNTGPELLG